MTVSALIEADNRYLMVVEQINGRPTINQPAGHLEHGESLREAVIREVLEETRFEFIPQALTGIYRWQAPDGGPTFMRVNFIGAVGKEDRTRRLDPDIDATRWMTRDEIHSSANTRSPLVLQCIDDYLAGHRYPMELLHELV